MDASPTADLARVRGWLAEARHIVVLTGAGMSAESGVPTFRDALTGLWATFDPEELASVEGFRANPARVWDWYAERGDGVRRAEPNAGHRALAQWARAHPGRMSIVTQNVDDLHQRAGRSPASTSEAPGDSPTDVQNVGPDAVPEIIRLHGDILARQWLDESACTRRPRCRTDEAEPGRPPRCATCGNFVRPGVVWFGEMLAEAAIERAQRLAASCAVMLVVGTSGAVWPAAGLAGLARRGGAKVVIVNTEPSEIDAEAHLVLRGTAAGVLPALLTSSLTP